MTLLAAPDADACVHGWPLDAEKPCFFCTYRSRTVAETAGAAPLVPEHRNPPAAEPKKTFSLSPQRGGDATRRRKPAQAKPTMPPKGGQCTGTTIGGDRCQRHAANGHFCMHHDPERAGARQRWREAVLRGGERAGAAPPPKAAPAPAAPVIKPTAAPGPPPANRADTAGRKGGSAEHAYRPIPRALRRLQNLEHQLDQMKETVRRCIADLAAAHRGDSEP